MSAGLALATRPDERLSALERLEVLCDPGSIHLLRTGVRGRRAGTPRGDGVLGALAEIDGRPAAVYAQDASVAGGSLGAVHADTILRVLGTAERARIPVVSWVDSAGARVQEGLDALTAYGEIFAAQVALHGRVPQIAIVAGTCAGGGAYSPALADLVVMTGRARMFLTGPRVVRDVMREDVDAETLGGPRTHGRSGVAHAVARDDAEAAALTRDLLAHLAVPREAGAVPLPQPPDLPVPADPRRVYDVRDVIRRLADGGRLSEVHARWAPNVVCAFARIDGRSTGVVASQPKHLGGVLDAEAAQKAAGFVSLCDRFGLPLVVLVDTPGFLPGRRQEAAAVIRHGAGLVRAFAAARVPKVTVVLRKAFGGAFIAMNARGLGADLVLAWPGAELGVMGARQAVGVVHRGAPEREREQLARDYADEHLTAEAAAAGGHVDEVVAPSATRARLAAALSTLDARRRP